MTDSGASGDVAEVADVGDVAHSDSGAFGEVAVDVSPFGEDATDDCGQDPDFSDDFFEEDVENSILRQFSGCITRVAQQGNIDTCWAFPASDIVAAYHYLDQANNESKMLIPLSRQELLDKVPKKEKRGREVTSYSNSVLNGFDYIKTNGLYPQNAYLKYGHIRDPNREPLDAASPKLRLSNYREISRKEAYVMVKDRPVAAVMGYINVFQEWKKYLPNRKTAWKGGKDMMVVPSYKAARYFKDCYHSILLVASGTVSAGKKYGGQRFFIAKNSFGPTYGCQGYCKIHERLLTDFFVPEGVKLFHSIGDDGKGVKLVHPIGHDGGDDGDMDEKDAGNNSDDGVNDVVGGDGANTPPSEQGMVRPASINSRKYSSRSEVYKSGPLFLSSKGIGWTSWNKRWFILTCTSLVFYRSYPNAVPQKGAEVNLMTLGGIDLNSSGSVVVKEDKKLLTVLFPDGRDGRDRQAFTLKGRKNLSMESIDLALEDENEIQRLEDTKAELQTRISEEAKENARLQASLEKRKNALHDRHLALERDDARLQEQLQKGRELRTALEAGLRTSQRRLAVSSTVDEKVTAEIQEIAQAEADVITLKQKADDLGLQLNQQREQNSRLQLDIGNQQQPSPNDNAEWRDRQKKVETASTPRNNEKSTRNKYDSRPDKADSDKDKKEESLFYTNESSLQNQQTDQVLYQSSGGILANMPPSEQGVDRPASTSSRKYSSGNEVHVFSDRDYVVDMLGFELPSCDQNHLYAASIL